MCGRYYIGLEGDETPEELLRIIDALNRRRHDGALKTSGEIFPTDVAPVLANARSGGIAPFAMRWGYRVPGGRPVINARAETAADKPMFRDGMARRRCLIPASGYFEWAREGDRRARYRIRPAGEGMCYLAGVYRIEQGQAGPVAAFSILTREAVPGVAFIHDRMPVILPAACARDWLNHALPAAKMIAEAAGEMAYWRD